MTDRTLFRSSRGSNDTGLAGRPRCSEGPDAETHPAPDRTRPHRTAEGPGSNHTGPGTTTSKPQDAGEPATATGPAEAGPSDASGSVETRLETPRARRPRLSGEAAPTPPPAPPEPQGRSIAPRHLRAAGTLPFRRHLDADGGGLTPRAFVEAAHARLPEIDIHPSAWAEACATLGRLTAAIAVLVIDRNRSHPHTPVRKPGGTLRAMTRRHANGTLNLDAALFAILQRGEPEEDVR